MLGRKSYSREEVESEKKAIKAQIASFKKLRNAIGGDDAAETVLRSFERLLFRNMLFALDRPFVHRLRSSTGKAGSPVNEVEILVDAVISNEGVLRGINAIKYVPEESVLGLRVGDKVELDAESFDRLQQAFFADLLEKFV